MPLSPAAVLINSRCCPCKGRISWAGLAPQHLSRYEPLTGARFINRLQEVGASPYPKYEPPSGALAPQVRDIRAALHGLKAQQVRSPGQRPGLTYVPRLRPVRAKVINNRCAHTFALTGRRALYPGTQGVALGWGLAALSGRSRRGLRGIAPERGAYSRIGACPYLPPWFPVPRCCPCKGRISLAGLAPQYLSRYEPLTGARFINRLQEVGASPYPKYEPLSGALAPHFIISPARPRNSLIRVIRCYAVRTQTSFVVIPIPNIFRCTTRHFPGALTT